MTIATFGVTATMMRADYFSQLGEFSTDSNPSSTSVDRYIQQKGAELAGKLRAEEQSPSAIEALTTSEAFLWCQETLCLLVACRIAEDMQQAKPPLADTWEKRLLERLAGLADDAVGTLGQGSATPTEQPDGPNTFIDTLDLDTSHNESCASSVDMPLRKDDRL
jgi:hypothetical protein